MRQPISSSSHSPAARAKLIFDPHCGVGPIPAVAKALGLDPLGLELAKNAANNPTLKR